LTAEHFARGSCPSSGGAPSGATSGDAPAPTVSSSSSSWADVEGFVRSHLPPPPARVLEVGCGPTGGLALALAARGWDVTAVDPLAPEGGPFVRATLEAFDPPGGEPFDAAVAVLSLHHLEDLPKGLDRLRSLLRPGGGTLVVDEFRKEVPLSHEATAAWYYHQRLSLLIAGRPQTEAEGIPLGGSPEAWRTRVSATWSGVHEGRALLAGLEGRFSRTHLSHGPFLFRMGLDDALEPMERALIEEGGLEPAGLRWVGVRGEEREEPTKGG